jgi:hypothetical protein
MSDETVKIKGCPHCGNAHTYALEVERAIVLKNILMDDTSEQPRRVKITRLFICPENNEQYQGTFYLYDTSSDRIQNVSVTGLVEEDE